MVDSPVKPCGNVVNDDLNKAEQEWARRSLFGPPRRRGRWLWLVVIAAVVAVLLLWQAEVSISTFL